MLEFLQGRSDAVLFGAQAVNAYVAEVRATQDVDIASLNGEAFAEELRAYLSTRFHIAVRVREIRDGIGYRIYQVRKPENRHLVDVRPVAILPPAQRLHGLLVVEPPELIANKVAALVARRGKPKSGTDWRDIASLLLRFPELKTPKGAVRERLEAVDAGAAVMAEWQSWAESNLSPEGDDDGY